MYCFLQYCALFHWHYFQFRNEYVPVPVNWNCVVISVHAMQYYQRCTLFWSWWDTELFGVSPGSKLCTNGSYSIAKHFKMVRYGYGLVPVIFSINLIVVFVYLCPEQLYHSCYHFRKVSDCILSGLTHAHFMSTFDISYCVCHFSMCARKSVFTPIFSLTLSPPESH